jgi:hypothetical protein
MDKKNLWLKLITVGLSIFLTFSVVFYEPTEVYADDCHAKQCEIDGIDCICCLIISGEISCQCGKFTCPPKV